MNYRENLTWASVAPLLLLIGTGATVLAVPGRPAMADLIKYQWQGTIVPREVGVDPWAIGEAARFSIAGIVDENAADLDDDIRDARFTLLDVHLLIDGDAPTSIGEGSITFRESSSDRVSISLDEVVVNGTNEPFVTSFRLDTSTFTFQNILESPPIFPPAMTIVAGTSVHERSSYRIGEELGATVTVTVIPEPSTFALILLALLGPTVFFWRSCTRLRTT